MNWLVPVLVCSGCALMGWWLRGCFLSREAEYNRECTQEYHRLCNVWAMKSADEKAEEQKENERAVDEMHDSEEGQTP